MMMVRKLLAIAVVGAVCCLPSSRAQFPGGNLNAFISNTMNQAMGAGNNAMAYSQQVQQQAQTYANQVTAQAMSNANNMVRGIAGGNVDARTCGVLSQTSSSSCANGHCCSISQKVLACNGKLQAGANINGRDSACCYLLKNNKTGKLAMMCAGECILQ
jgi:hypothetical protein